MTSDQPRPATEESYFLAEGPVWDPIRERLLWVDIMAGTVQVGRLAGDGGIGVDDVITFPDPVGAVAVSTSGELIVACGDRLLRRGTDGAVSAIATVIGTGPAQAERRLNDGKPDPSGRFVVGSLDMAGPSTTETLTRLEDDGTLTTLDDDLTLANGLGWSADGSVLYSIDTQRRRVYRRSYAPSGAVGERETFLQLPQGFPDGMCLDAEDHLWIAIWGLGQVRRYAPSGELVDQLDLPAPHTSCVTFAGADLDVLVITTATENLSPEEIAAQPLSGRLFTMRPGVRGAAPRFWNGFGSG